MPMRCHWPTLAFALVVSLGAAHAQTERIPIGQSEPNPVQPANLLLPTNGPLPLGGQPVPRFGTGAVPLPPTGTPPPPGFARPGLGQGAAPIIIPASNSSPPEPQPMQQPGPMPMPVPRLQPVPPSAPMPMPMPMSEPAPLPTPEVAPMPVPMPKSAPVIGSSSVPMNSVAPPTIKQSPMLTIETTGPESITIGQQTSYEIHVRNTGTSPVFQVRIEEELPPGVKYLGGDPVGEVVGDRIVWTLGVLESTAEKKVRVDIRPTVEGELKTRATVTTSAVTGLRSKVTRPKVTAGITGPTTASVGEQVVFQITLTNAGNAQANRMMLRATLSDGLQHVQGSVIEAELAGIPAGESKTVSLRTTAAKAGNHHCDLLVVTEGGAESNAKAAVQIVQPSLQIKQLGPTKCLVNAEPTYTVEVSNPGSSPTAPVQVLTTVPEGLTFVSATEDGSYDSSRRIITWNFPAQSAGASKSMTFKARANSAGEWVVKSMAQAGPRLDSKAETHLKIEGIPALFFEVVDLADPIPTDKETTYEIRIVNQGTCACTNIQLTALMSEGMQATQVTGPIGHKTMGQQITFEPLPRLATKADTVIRVKVRPSIAGDLRFKVQLTCNEIRQPITKEESTRAFKNE